jgi:hypothetical protein
MTEQARETPEPLTPEALRTAHPAATRRAAQGEDYFTALADEAACRAATPDPALDRDIPLGLGA